jgi:hypothetical protein
MSALDRAGLTENHGGWPRRVVISCDDLTEYAPDIRAVPLDRSRRALEVPRDLGGRVAVNDHRQDLAIHRRQAIENHLEFEAFERFPSGGGEPRLQLVEVCLGSSKSVPMPRPISGVRISPIFYGEPRWTCSAAAAGDDLIFHVPDDVLESAGKGLAKIVAVLDPRELASGPSLVDPRQGRVDRVIGSELGGRNASTPQPAPRLTLHPGAVEAANDAQCVVIAGDKLDNNRRQAGTDEWPWRVLHGRHPLHATAPVIVSALSLERCIFRVL